MPYRRRVARVSVDVGRWSCIARFLGGRRRVGDSVCWTRCTPLVDESGSVRRLARHRARGADGDPNQLWVAAHGARTHVDSESARMTAQPRRRSRAGDHRGDPVEGCRRQSQPASPSATTSASRPSMRAGQTRFVARPSGCPRPPGAPHLYDAVNTVWCRASTASASASRPTARRHFAYWTAMPRESSPAAFAIWYARA